jgi:hypothetical protein
MKKVEVLGIDLALSELKSDGLYGVKFSHALVQNTKTFKNEAHNIKNSLVYSKEFLMFCKEMEEVFIKYALKDENGELLVVDNKYKIDPENIEIFNKIQKEKREANKSIIEEAKKAEETYNNSLDTEKEVDIAYVKLEDLPETITPEQMSALSFMIEDI